MRLIHENKVVDVEFPFLEFWIEGGSVTEVLFHGVPLPEDGYESAEVGGLYTFGERVRLVEALYPVLCAEKAKADAEEEDAIKYAKEICR